MASLFFLALNNFAVANSASDSVSSAPTIVGYSGAFKAVDYWVKLSGAVRDHVRSRDAAFLDYTGRSQTTLEQIEAVQRAIDNDVDVMVLGPVSDSAVKGLSMLREVGIPLVLVNSNLNHEWVSSTILTDNHKAAKLAARHLHEGLQQRSRPTGKIIIVTGDPESKDARTRGEVAADYFRRSSGYQVEVHYAESWDGGRAFEIAHNALTRHRDEVVGMFATFAPGSIALTVAAEASQTSPLIMGFDFDLSVQALIQSGKLVGTVTQNPEVIGRKGAETAFKVLNGEPVERTIYVEPVLVTEIN